MSTVFTSGPLVATRDWELLADMPRAADPGTIHVWVDQDAFADAWELSFPGLSVPSTTIDDPIFVMFNLLVQDGCPEATIDEIVLDPQAALVFGEFTRSPGRTSCGDIAGDHTFVAAIRRAALPDGHVTFRLEREFSVCADCGREREQVEVDL